ncbi:flavodoxin domain-containing protein [Clostridium sp. D33t1_170424_F3]|uniref:flavodoxin domain-containing protein n=1 Tax=Clostridium sp. D33t1_170424_F3 TaxID=2787099 RepID=UPI0018AA3AA9|nr:flavodoxin domain-containing protein [Clostridium sp. D33t1_170424_F3]
MKTVIVYASKYGCTEQCVSILEQHLKSDVSVCEASQAGKLDLQSFDCIIAGASVYALKLRKEMQAFCTQNESLLLQKKLGLFICCSTPLKQADYIDHFYAPALLEHAIAKANFGGEIHLEKMRWGDRMVMKLVEKSPDFQYPHILEKEIQQFASVINNP